MFVRTESGGASRLGQKATQQDRFVTTKGLVGVMDGVSTLMGEVAASAVAQSEHLKNLNGYDPEALHAALIATNNDIVIQANERGMRTATTATMGIFDEPTGSLAVCHIGDSTLLLFRDRGIAYRTSRHIAQSGKLLRAIGARLLDTTNSGFERGIIQLHAGDIVLIHSDGLRDAMTEGEMLRVAQEQRASGATAQETADALADLAMSRGVRDNVTAVVVFVSEASAPAIETAEVPLAHLEEITEQVPPPLVPPALPLPAPALPEPVALGSPEQPRRPIPLWHTVLAAMAGTLLAHRLEAVAWTTALPALWRDLQGHPGWTAAASTLTLATAALLLLKRRGWDVTLFAGRMP